MKMNEEQLCYLRKDLYSSPPVIILQVALEEIISSITEIILAN